MLGTTSLIELFLVDLSETSSRSFLILDFDSILSSNNGRYLQNLTVLKNVRNSQAARQCGW